jgi:hypothetical protein
MRRGPLRYLRLYGLGRFPAGRPLPRARPRHPPPEIAELTALLAEQQVQEWLRGRFRPNQPGR